MYIVWGRGWTTCLLHDSPFFGSHFKIRVGMWVWSDISYIYYILPRFTVSCMKLVIFYFIITFSYTKYFVHSYTVDVVFTLSYIIRSFFPNSWGFVTVVISSMPVIPRYMRPCFNGTRLQWCPNAPSELRIKQCNGEIVHIQIIYIHSFMLYIPSLRIGQFDKNKQQHINNSSYNQGIEYHLRTINDIYISPLQFPDGIQ